MSAAPLAFVHTAEANLRLFGDLVAEVAPEMPVRHVVAADLLAEATAAGGLGPDLRTRVRQVLLAAAEGAAVVLCTCSTLGDCADEAARGSAVPILRVDRPMAEEAVARGPRILVAACVPTTLGPTTTLLAATARTHGRDVVIDTLLLSAAWGRFLAGERDAYLAEVAAGLASAAGSADVIVLAQASMAGAADLCRDVAVPVLSSPRSGLAAARAVWIAQSGAR